MDLSEHFCALCINEGHFEWGQIFGGSIQTIKLKAFTLNTSKEKNNELYSRDTLPCFYVKEKNWKKATRGYN